MATELEFDLSAENAKCLKAFVESVIEARSTTEPDAKSDIGEQLIQMYLESLNRIEKLENACLRNLSSLKDLERDLPSLIESGRQAREDVRLVRDLEHHTRELVDLWGGGKGTLIWVCGELIFRTMLALGGAEQAAGLWEFAQQRVKDEPSIRRTAKSEQYAADINAQICSWFKPGLISESYESYDAYAIRQGWRQPQKDSARGKDSIHIHVPAAEPVVNVQSATPDVHVQAAAPDIHVSAKPADITVNPEITVVESKKAAQVKRDRQGRITGVEYE